MKDERYEDVIKLFKAIVKEFVYTTPHMLQIRHGFPHYVFQMFRAFYYDPKLLPEEIYNLLPERINKERKDKISQRHLEVWSKSRVICDYLSGMTDHYFLRKYKKMFQGGEVSFLYFQ